MKLRIHEDSVRLRLTRSEVSALGSDGLVESSLVLPPATTFRFRLETGDAFSVSLDDAALTVVVPESAVAGWVGTDEDVGIYGDVRADDASVSVIVEKDFNTFIPRPDVDPDEYYPNPKKPRHLP